MVDMATRDDAVPAPGESASLLRRIAMPAVAVLLLILAWFAVSRLAADVSYADLRATIAATAPATLLAALAFTALSFAALTLYDLGALAFVGIDAFEPGSNTIGL